MKIIQCCLHVDGIPGNDGIGDEIETVGLVDMLIRMLFANTPTASWLVSQLMVDFGHPSS